MCSWGRFCTGTAVVRRIKPRRAQKQTGKTTCEPGYIVWQCKQYKGSSDTLGAEFYPFDKFCRLVGFEHVWEFDKRWPEA